MKKGPPPLREDKMNSCKYKNFEVKTHHDHSKIF